MILEKPNIHTFAKHISQGILGSFSFSLLPVEQQLPEQVQYGLEGGSVFLECEPRNPHTSIKWLTQTENSDKRKVVSHSSFYSE